MRARTSASMACAPPSIRARRSERLHRVRLDAAPRVALVRRASVRALGGVLRREPRLALHLELHLVRLAFLPGAALERLVRLVARERHRLVQPRRARRPPRRWNAPRERSDAPQPSCASARAVAEDVERLARPRRLRGASTRAFSASAAASRRVLLYARPPRNARANRESPRASGWRRVGNGRGRRWRWKHPPRAPPRVASASTRAGGRGGSPRAEEAREARPRRLEPPCLATRRRPRTPVCSSPPTPAPPARRPRQPPRSPEGARASRRAASRGTPARSLWIAPGLARPGVWGRTEGARAGTRGDPRARRPRDPSASPATGGRGGAREGRRAHSRGAREGQGEAGPRARAACRGSRPGSTAGAPADARRASASATRPAGAGCDDGSRCTWNPTRGEEGSGEGSTPNRMHLRPGVRAGTTSRP